MQYQPLDSSGTDDDLPPTYQPRGPRVIFNGNGSLPQPSLHSNVDREIRQIEQQAYTGVLRAFKVQSDAITWEKESLITELRKELQISDKEHRVLLKGVTEEEAVCRIRQSRQTGGTQSSSHHSSVVHTPVPAKRQKKSHSVPVTPQASVITMHAVVGKKLFYKGKGRANQGLLYQGGRQASDRVLKRLPSNNSPMLGSSRRRGRLHPNELIKGYSPLDGFGIPNTGNVVMEVEKVLSNPNMLEIEKAMKLLRDQEQSLLDAIARLDEASDGENEITALKIERR
uniref:ENT domain-containing protein n=1 Tax=Oryza glumipatula TaxID=40148 RepID=A0A0E0AXI2_9ORYZ